MNWEDYQTIVFPIVFKRIILIIRIKMNKEDYLDSLPNSLGRVKSVFSFYSIVLQV